MRWIRITQSHVAAGLVSALVVLFHHDGGFPFLATVHAFVPSVHRASSPTRLQSAGNLQDVEQARAFLEDLLRQQEELESTTSALAEEGPLTTTGRHRRLLEIELLKSLRKSEEGVNKLMHLWMYEIDASMAHELEDMQEVCSAGMVAEEVRLQEMIYKNPYWAEPRARLALLLFFKGRTEEAFEAAMDTLRIKPWHFEIYPLLVMISLREQDFGQALIWARRALPPLREGGPNKRRDEWIRIAVELAQERYAEAEQRTQVSKDTSSSLGETTEDAWQ